MTRRTTWISLLLVWAVAWPYQASSPPPNLDTTLEAQHERISMDPKSSLAWNDLGNLLVLADRMVEAEEAYRQAISLSPDDAAARFNLALLLHQQDRAGEAAREFEELISYEPRHAWAHYQLGVILAEKKDRSGALEHYARALAYDPNLTFAEHNPHIIDNPLFSEALLRSQRYMESSSSRVPRVYSEPDRLVEMMLELEMKESGEEGEGTGEDEGEGSGEGEEGGTSGGGANAHFDTSSGSDRPAGAGARGARGAAGEVPRGTPSDIVVVEPRSPSAAVGEESPQGSTGRRSLSRRLPPRGSPAPSPSSRSRRGVPPSSADPRADDETPPPVRLTPPPPTRSSRYLPGRRSTSQLDLKLLPDDEEPPVRQASLGAGG